MVWLDTIDAIDVSLSFTETLPQNYLVSYGTTADIYDNREDTHIYIYIYMYIYIYIYIYRNTTKMYKTIKQWKLNRAQPLNSI